MGVEVSVRSDKRVPQTTKIYIMDSSPAKKRKRDDYEDDNITLTVSTATSSTGPVVGQSSCMSLVFQNWLKSGQSPFPLYNLHKKQPSNVTPGLAGAPKTRLHKA